MLKITSHSCYVGAAMPQFTYTANDTAVNPELVLILNSKFNRITFDKATTISNSTRSTWTLLLLVFQRDSKLRGKSGSKYRRLLFNAYYHVTTSALNQLSHLSINIPEEISVFAEMHYLSFYVSELCFIHSLINAHFAYLPKLGTIIKSDG